MTRLLKPLKVVIIGGVAGGATAAARARRVSELSKIIMLERDRFVSIASCGLPYHVSGEIANRESLLVATPEHLQATLNLDVRPRHEVVSIDRAKKSIHVSNLAFPKNSPGASFDIDYDKLLIATGASPTLPPIPGLMQTLKAGRLFTLRTIDDMDGIIESVKRNGCDSDVVIVGAGFIGLEMVEAFSRCGMKVTLIEDKASVLPIMDKEMSAPVAEEMALHGVKVIASDKVVRFEDNAETKCVELELSSGKIVKTRFVVMSIGVKPESGLAAKCDIKLDARGAIEVNPFMQTSDPDIYAVGDVASTPFCILPRQSYLPLGGPANRMARIASDHMFLGDAGTDPYRGSFGTSIVRVFDIVAGKTGMSENDCIRSALDFGVATITGPSNASYYPGSFPITMKVCYNRSNGKLLGAQAVGGLDGVDKRLDVISTALAGNMTIDDLAHLDLSYAPPFGSARDVINTAGFAGRNLRTGMVTMVPTLEPIGGKDPIVLDVRDATSAAVRPVPSLAEGGADSHNVVNIPMEELRDRIDEVKKLAARGQPIILLCNLGKMSYFSSRILTAHGIEVRSLNGGLSMLKTKKFTVLPDSSSRPAANKQVPSAASVAAAAGAATLTPAAPATIAADNMRNEILDLCGLACPGPIMAIRKKIPSLSPGQQLTVKASDPGFYNDFPAFCRSGGLTVISCTKESGIITGVLMKPLENVANTTESSSAAAAAHSVAADTSKDLALVVFSGDMDKVLAAFVLANGAVAMDRKVTMFFTFWGLNALRNTSDKIDHGDKDVHLDHPNHSIMDRMFTAMMPKGADALPLSKMQMGGIGPMAMKMQMKRKHLPNLPDLMRDAKAGNVRMVACTMSMAAFGLESEDLVDGIEYGGVADFLEASGNSKNTMFI